MSASGRAAADGDDPRRDRAPSRRRTRHAAASPWLRAAAASTKPAKSGCGSHGRERNSGMELAGDEARVVGQLDDLDQLLLGPDPRDAQPVLLEALQVVVVDLVAVAVALLDDPLPVQPRGQRALGQRRSGRGPSRMVPPLSATVALLGQEVDHRVRRRRRRTRRSWRRRARTRGARTRSPRTACPRQMPKKGTPLLARVAHRLDLALDAAVAEAARAPGCRRRRAKWAAAPSRSMLLGVDPLHLHAGVVGDAAVGERLVQALVGVLELDVLADHRDARRRRRATSPAGRSSSQRDEVDRAAAAGRAA